MSILLDKFYMMKALDLAKRKVGQTGSNPAVGCLIVHNTEMQSCIKGQGCTQPGGRPHAETVALLQAGSAARGATLYTTLEPCAHYGQTMPCVDAIIAAGVQRVVSAMVDPDPRVNGRGYERILAAGIALEHGVLSDAARAVNIGYVRRICEGRPFVQLKLAHCHDGMIAGAGNKPLHITGDIANTYVHHMRAKANAIMIGRGTLQSDDPQLTCRLPDAVASSPIRIVLDSTLRTSPSSRLVQMATTIPSWIIAGFQPRMDRVILLKDKSVRILMVKQDMEGRLDLLSVLHLLAKEGIGRLLVEGGAALARSFIVSRLVDEITLIEGDVTIGNSGLSCFDDACAELIRQNMKYVLVETRVLGKDILRRYIKRT